MISINKIININIDFELNYRLLGSCNKKNLNISRKSLLTNYIAIIIKQITWNCFKLVLFFLDLTVIRYIISLLVF